MYHYSMATGEKLCNGNIVLKFASSKSTANETLRWVFFGPSRTFEIWVNRFHCSNLSPDASSPLMAHEMGFVELACPLLLVSSASAQPNGCF